MFCFFLPIKIRSSYVCRSKSEIQAAAEKWGEQALASLSAYRDADADSDAERVSGEQNVAFERLRSSTVGVGTNERSASASVVAAPSPLALPDDDDEFPEGDPLLGSSGLLSPQGDPNSLFAESPRVKKRRAPPLAPRFLVDTPLAPVWNVGAQKWVELFPDVEGIERRKRTGVRVSVVVALVVTFMIALSLVWTRVSTLQHQLDTLQAHMDSHQSELALPSVRTTRSADNSEALLRRLSALESSLMEIQLQSNGESPPPRVRVDTRTPSQQRTPAAVERCAESDLGSSRVDEELKSLHALISETDDLNSIRGDILSKLDALAR